MKSNMSLVKEYLQSQVLLEAEEAQADPQDTPANVEGPTVDGNDSIDSQIDHYLSGYESEATNAVVEGKDLRNITRGFLTESILEADEEEPADDESGNEESGDDNDLAPEEPAVMEPPPKKSVGEIDIRSYASSVSRLITNLNSLIETRNTVLRRSLNHLSSIYDPMVIRQLEIVLEDEHGLVIGKSKKDMEDDIHAPPAANAGPIGG